VEAHGHDSRGQVNIARYETSPDTFRAKAGYR